MRVTGDYDNDGRLDLFIANNRGNQQASPNMLYKNMGNAIFVEVTGTSITESAARTNDAAFADIDNDGDLDIIVANHGSINKLHMFTHCDALNARLGRSHACASIPEYARRAANSDQSIECPPHFTRFAVLTECQPCAPGFERMLGALSCSKCPMGMSQSLGEGTQCVSCSPGTYSNVRARGAPAVKLAHRLMPPLGSPRTCDATR